MYSSSFWQNVLNVVDIHVYTCILEMFKGERRKLLTNFLSSFCSFPQIFKAEIYDLYGPTYSNSSYSFLVSVIDLMVTRRCIIFSKSNRMISSIFSSQVLQSSSFTSAEMRMFSFDSTDLCLCSKLSFFSSADWLPSVLLTFAVLAGQS